MINSGIGKITLVPLDATHQALVSLDDCAALRALARRPERRRRVHRAAHRGLRPDPADEAAECRTGPRRARGRVLVDPAVIWTSFLHVDVETNGELTVGETVVDTNHRGDGEPNVHFAHDADEPRFVDLLLATFTRR